jgi:hypothetical protein
LRVGFVVEGPDDKAVIPVLVARVLEQATGSSPAIADELIRFAQFGKFGRHPWLYCGPLKSRGAELVVAVFDNDRAPHDARLRLIEEGLKASPVASFMTAVGIAVQEMEAWLLADVRTLARVVSAEVAEPSAREDIPDPKAYLARIFAASPLLAMDSGTLANIAEQIDMSTLERECKSFRRFKDQVIDVARRCASPTLQFPPPEG